MAADPEVTLRLWPRAESCRDARRAIRAFCLGGPCAGITDDAVLLTSELVANAIEHAGTMVTLVAMHDDDALVVVVSDDCVDPPVRRRPGSSTERGRGIGVVSELAGAWGVTPRNDGKSVWFRLAV